MATSGTYNFAPQVDDLIIEAWERCGKNGSELTSEIARSARRSLHLALIDWTNRELNLWQVERFATTVQAGVYAVPTPLATVDVLEVLVTQNNLELMCEPIGRDDYAALTNKATLTGRPTQFWSDRRNDVPVIYLFPVPDQAYPLTVYRIRLPQDVNGMTEQVDAPILWSEALCAELAARLAEKYAPDRLQEKRALADRAYNFASEEDRERVPLTLLPRLAW